ncbi:MAG: hypothetical protein Q4A11_03750 [Brachymonas sp.]|nr:hypothetical protein [Brachymonas sp.]
MQHPASNPQQALRQPLQAHRSSHPAKASKNWRRALLPLLLAGLSQTACAQIEAYPGSYPSAAPAPVPVAPYVHGPVARVRIIDRDSGRELPVYRHRGEYWVAGRPGARYGIAIMGHPRFAPGRVEAVVSVDGVNVITGQTASVRQSGYVLDVGQWHTITGWRKNDQEVAAFHFTSLPRSYAARTGRPAHVGVIGVALYREQAAPPIVRPQPWLNAEPAYEYGEDALIGHAQGSRAPQAEAASGLRDGERAAKSAPVPYGSRLGTGHGRREDSAVGYTTFVRRSSRPDQIVRIRYDSEENLRARGIIPDYGWQPPVRPQPFPEPAPRRYVPDPPSW